MVQIQTEVSGPAPREARDWAKMAAGAATHEEAQTQLLYTLNVQMLKHRVFVQNVVYLTLLLAVALTIALVVLSS